MNHSLNRRRFLATSASVLAAPYFLRSQGSPNGKLNIACIGTAGRAAGNIEGVKGENIVALVDVDSANLAKAGEKFPMAKRYADFRKMLEQKDIDAVVVATPDHTHAVCAVAAMRSGRHVYCEKPLARTVSEVRVMTDTAAQTKRITQMGNQIHSHPGNNYRRCVELVQSGAIGAVREVHVWAGAIYGNKTVVANPPPPPATLDYDLWLGPVQYVSYRPEYVPFHWRHFWHFGGGTLADFWCHFGDLAHWALDLKHPLTIEAEGPAVDPELVPVDLKVRYEYPARGKQPPVKLTWYQGKYRPEQELGPLLDKWKGGGVLFVGEKGRLLANYTQRVLLPEDKFVNFQPPTPFVPDAKGNNWHHEQWIQAIKTGGKAECDFSYAGPLSEAGLLGNVAFRVGKKLVWDAKTLKAKGCPEADQFIQHKYREGWKI
jgi:predicted dehydrogenase